MSKKKIYRAGVIPYYYDDGELKMLFMKPSDPKFGGDTFQIAKGKHEEGESAIETGLREAGEELGLFSGNVIRTDEVGEFMGRTTIFVSEITDPDKFGDPCDETGEVKWMTPKEFQKNGRDLHKPVVKAAVRTIEEQQTLQEAESLEYFDTTLYEMSNFNTTSTGLMDNSKVWVRAEPVELPHTKFRFKIMHPQKGEAVFGFWGDSAEQVEGTWKLTGSDLKRTQTFAQLNRDALISHINGEIDSGELAISLVQNKEKVLKG